MPRIVETNRNVKTLMTIQGINVYSAASIMAEIDDVARFSSKEKLRGYAGRYRDKTSPATLT